MKKLEFLNYTKQHFEQDDDDFTVINETYYYENYLIGIHMTHVDDLQAEGIMRISDLKSNEELAYTHVDVEYFENDNCVKKDYILEILKDYEAGKLKKLYLM